MGALPSLRTVIAIVVTVIWAIAYAISLVHPVTKVPPELTTVLLVIVTSLFASEARRHGNGNGGQG